MILQWFLSKTVRHATAMHRHVRKLLHHQRDILQPAAIEGLNGAIADMQKAIADRLPKADLEKQMAELEKAANKWLRPYPNAVWRENVEVLLVALAVAMGIRTFFLQPFKIPTGSMQPTLYGVTSENLIETGGQPSSGWEGVKEWFAGASYLRVKAPEDGTITGISKPFKFLIFNIQQTVFFNGKPIKLWFPPDCGGATLGYRAGLAAAPYREFDSQPRTYRKGDDIIHLKVVSGDHLFVDRLTFNFRSPKRGEVIVFETKGIPEDQRYRAGIPADQFYIKRLVGLGGENVRIGEDRHLVVNGQRLDASVPHFERVYSFDPKVAPKDSHYSGHVNYPQLAPFFYEKPDGVTVPKGEFLAMGDNTVSSLDSRTWGSFPSQYVIGKAFFVYWPITGRFGWDYHR
jgi:signal peptidase I